MIATALYQYRNRFYDPVHGRFATREPRGVWADPGQFGNSYGFGGDSPINATDWSGLHHVFNRTGHSIFVRVEVEHKGPPVYIEIPEGGQFDLDAGVYEGLQGRFADLDFIFWGFGARTAFKTSNAQPGDAFYCGETEAGERKCGRDNRIRDDARGEWTSDRDEERLHPPLSCTELRRSIAAVMERLPHVQHAPEVHRTYWNVLRHMLELYRRECLTEEGDIRWYEDTAQKGRAKLEEDSPPDSVESDIPSYEPKDEKK